MHCFCRHQVQAKHNAEVCTLGGKISLKNIHPATAAKEKKQEKKASAIIILTLLLVQRKVMV